MNWRAAPGFIAVAGPVVAITLALTGPPAPHAWPHSPPEPPLPKPKVMPRWDEGSQASLELVRRVTEQEARRAVRTLSACETSAKRLPTSERSASYRKCAFTSISRTGEFAQSNSRLLSNLLQSAQTTHACHEGVLELTGTTSTLALTARSAARETSQAAWGELLAASHSIRGLAKASLKLADARSLDRACKPLKPGPPPPDGPVA